MNILDIVADVLAAKGIVAVKGYLPDQPDRIAALFEYPGNPPEHFFSGTDDIHGVQVRARDLTADGAFTLAQAAAMALNRYYDSAASITQSTPVVDIGWDGANPQRAEYTVNFTIRRY